MSFDPTNQSQSNEPAVTPSERPGSQQFSLISLMAMVAGMAVLFGVLTWLGLRGSGALVAFAAAGSGALGAIVLIELFWAFRNWLRSSHARSDWTQPNIPQAEPARVPGQELNSSE